MATKTDLDGYLYNEDPSLLSRLEQWVAGVTIDQLPASVTLHWRHAGGASWEKFAEFPIAGLPISAAGVVERARELVVAHMGPQPQGGALRARVAVSGKKSMPDVDHTRTLTAGEDDDRTEIAWLRRELVALRAHNQSQQAQLVAMGAVVVNSTASANTLAAQQSQTIGVLATTRATATAADEWSKATTLIGGVALLWFMPQIKRRLGLPDDAPIEDVISAARNVLRHRGESPRPAPTPPPGARAPAQLETVTTPSPIDEPEVGEAVEVASRTPDQEISDFLTRFRSDPNFARALGLRALKEPQLAEELKQAAIAAMGA